MAKRIPDVSGRVATRADVEWSEDSFGRVEIHRPRFGRVRAGLLRALRVRPTLTVRLDPLGSEVWKLLDGRTVGAVLAALREAHPGKDDLQARLSAFLSRMVSNGLVDLAEDPGP